MTGDRPTAEDLVQDAFLGLHRRWDTLVDPPGDAKASPVIMLAIYSVSTGARLRAWTAPTQITTDLAVRTLSWLDSGRQLVFSASTGPAHHLQLRALDVTGPGTDLMAGSRALLTADNPGTSACHSMQITPDGGTVICATLVATGSLSDTGCANGGPKLIAFPLPVGHQPGRVLYQYRGGCHDAESSTLWTDASASTIIGWISISTASTKVAFEVGVITGGRFLPLNIAKSVPQGEYPDLAF